MRGLVVNEARIEDRAAALRRVFDAAFALPPPAGGAATEDFLAIRVGGDPYAVRVTSVARLVSAPKIVAVPSRRPGVLGVAAIRGALVSVHSLAVVLGYAGDAPSRWIALAAGRDMVGLAWGELDGFLRVPKGASGAIGTGDLTRPIIDVAAILETITTGKTGPTRSDA
jgi:hypothetical protein